MSERDDASTEQAGVIVGGSVAALRELADPPRLSQPELDIIRWYGTLVQRLSGPRVGDERGPAQLPPWMKHGPRIDIVEPVRETTPALRVEGSGLGQHDRGLGRRQCGALAVGRRRRAPDPDHRSRSATRR